MAGEHPNVERIRRIFEAFRGGEVRPLFDCIAEGCVWRVAGKGELSRVYAGREQVFELFRATRRLTGGTYRSTLRWALADEERAVAVYRAQGRRNGLDLDIDQVLVIRVADGRWAEVDALPLDPAAFEAFWARPDAY